MEDNVLFAFGLTLFAGLSTGIGSALAFFTKRTNKIFLSVSLGFSAGVMIYVSFVEIFSEAKRILTETHREKLGYWFTALAFFGGILIIAIIDRLVPSFENPHEVRTIEDINKSVSEDKKLMRMGLFSALAIAIHNFPEGIAISVPIYYATGDRKKAFLLSFLSGLAEPVGALVGYLILKPFLNETVLGILFASVAGIMVFISLDELLPTAKEYGKHHSAIYGLIAGMAVMAVSLLLFV